LSLTHSAGSGSRKGLLLAALILLGWLITLIGLLSLDLSSTAGPRILIGAALALLLRTLLQTGLFIVGHDAMHGVLIPHSRRWNDRFGALALALYAALPYRACRRNHQRHHRCTASHDDPDFHPEPGAGFLVWYVRFMAGYLSATQMGRLLAAWALLALLARGLSPTGPLNLLLFCTLPLLLSSLQLFGFGTYLPHRGQRSSQRCAASDAPASLNLPGWLSLLACFHFGYHLEHHQNPGLAWFELPEQRRRRLALAPAGTPV
jgi:beta-carotene ketolase (CrtW type)